MDVRTITLAAGARTRITRPGRFFILVATAEALDVTFERNRGTSGEVARSVEAGFKRFPGDWSNPNDGKFDALVLTSVNAQTITYGISDSAADYAATLGTVTVQQSNDGDTAPDQTADSVQDVMIAANPNRRKVHLQNVGTANARVAPGTVTPTRGVRLVPGQSVTFETTAAINGRREGSVTTVISVTEETRT